MHINYQFVFLLGVFVSLQASEPLLKEKKILDSFSLGAVMTGIDILRRDGFKALEGRRVGLITNQTGISGDGKSTVELLSGAQQCTLVALFSPEHGLAGTVDAKISDTVDKGTGLIIYSLYGKITRPTESMLKDLDTLVFDVQDIGTRFYTYIATMGEAMIAASDQKKSFFVLDRPNPINGVAIAGPMRDEGQQSFTYFHNIPVRHGMTAAELALMIRAERNLPLDLHVVPCEGWRRQDFFDATGLMWVNPSPNMRTPTQALLYPGIGLLESSNLSVGRGTDTPFEIIGAPWLNGRLLACMLNKRAVKGICFVPTEFTPRSSKYEKRKCGGVLMNIVDRSCFEPLRTCYEIAVLLKRLFPEWEAHYFRCSLVNQKTLQALLDGKEAEEIEMVAQEGIDEFKKRRALYLQYT